VNPFLFRETVKKKIESVCPSPLILKVKAAVLREYDTGTLGGELNYLYEYLPLIISLFIGLFNESYYCCYFSTYKLLLYERISHECYECFSTNHFSSLSIYIYNIIH